MVTWLRPDGFVSTDDAHGIADAMSHNNARLRFGAAPMVMVHDFRNTIRLALGARDILVQWGLQFRNMNVGRLHVATNSEMGAIPKMALATALMGLRLAGFSILHNKDIEATLLTLSPASREPAPRPLSLY